MWVQNIWNIRIEGPSEKDWAFKQLEEKYMRALDGTGTQDVYKIDAPILLGRKL
jgi:hypothetical protein